MKVSFKVNKGNTFGDFGYCPLNSGCPLNTGFTVTTPRSSGKMVILVRPQCMLMKYVSQSTKAIPMNFSHSFSGRMKLHEIKALRVLHKISLFLLLYFLTVKFSS